MEASILEFIKWVFSPKQIKVIIVVFIIFIVGILFFLCYFNISILGYCVCSNENSEKILISIPEPCKHKKVSFPFIYAYNEEGLIISETQTIPSNSKIDLEIITSENSYNIIFGVDNEKVYYLGKEKGKTKPEVITSKKADTIRLYDLQFTGKFNVLYVISSPCEFTYEKNIKPFVQEYQKIMSNSIDGVKGYSYSNYYLQLDTNLAFNQSYTVLLNK